MRRESELSRLKIVGRYRALTGSNWRFEISYCLYLQGRI